MKKSYLLVTFAVIILLAFSSGAALAAAGAVAAEDAEDAAGKLCTLGLFRGVGTSADGSADFALDRVPNRVEAVAMVVRLIGMEEEARCGYWEMPFTDVPAWAKPAVGYAYENGLVYGVNDLTFASDNPVSAPEYLTLILRALGYKSGQDFEWDKAWELSDVIGVTDGSYCGGNDDFLRGDVAKISFCALGAKYKDSEKTLCAVLIENGVFTEDDAYKAGVCEIAEAAAPPQDSAPPVKQATDWSSVSDFEKRVFDLINDERKKHGLEALEWDSALAGVAHAHSTDMAHKGYFAHVNLEGKSPCERKWDAGITFKFSGENIAYGYKTPESVVRAWMDSPSHKKVILSDMATHMGVGVYNYHWTVDFTG